MSADPGAVAESCVDAIWDRWDVELRDWDLEGSSANIQARRLAIAVLTARVEQILETERQRIRQLAIEHHAHYDCDPDYGTPFADLLEGEQS